MVQLGASLHEGCGFDPRHGNLRRVPHTNALPKFLMDKKTAMSVSGGEESDRFIMFPEKHSHHGMDSLRVEPAPPCCKDWLSGDPQLRHCGIFLAAAREEIKGVACLGQVRNTRRLSFTYCLGFKKASVTEPG